MAAELTLVSLYTVGTKGRTVTGADKGWIQEEWTEPSLKKLKWGHFKAKKAPPQRWGLLYTTSHTEASIPAFQLTGTHACNGLARRNNYQVEGEGIQRDEERPKACCCQHSKASPKEGRPEGQVGICTACGHRARPRERGVHNPHGWRRGCFWNTPCTSPDYLWYKNYLLCGCFHPPQNQEGSFLTHLWAPGTTFHSSFCSLPLIQNNFTS
nr:zinc finger protein 740 isoform X1 [Kogia breviceps]